MAAIFGFLGLVAVMIGLISLVVPLRFVGVRTRTTGLKLAGVGAVAVIIGAISTGPAPGPGPVATGSSLGSVSIATSPATAPIADTALVVSITDGDTIRVRFADGREDKVRLIGIDSPEPGQEHSQQATARLAELIEGRTVTLVTDVSDRDRYGRLLRYIYVGETFVNLEMIRSGLAVAKRYEPDIAMAGELEAAQAGAELARVGLWASPAPPGSSAPTTIAANPPTSIATLTTSTTSIGVIISIPPPSDCHPSYRGSCVPVGVSDVDCLGGSGNGPYYTGRVEVIGSDEYGLDRDGDGIGCETS